AGAVSAVPSPPRSLKEAEIGGPWEATIWANRAASSDTRDRLEAVQAGGGRLPCARLPVVAAPLFVVPLGQRQEQVSGQRMHVGLVHPSQGGEALVVAGGECKPGS